MLRTLTPNLMVENVSDTVDWYRAVLGFEQMTEVPGEDGSVFAIVRRDEVQLMFQLRSSLGDELPDLRAMPIGASQTFYIEVDGVEDLRRTCDGKVRILKDLHDTFYGTREFCFSDCNGYILSFSETIAADQG
ncbi:MAG TPA: VOC family protein [Chloroflexota bacterium]|nr:VOC family protein [Chloroflexota bacterium]